VGTRARRAAHCRDRRPERGRSTEIIARYLKLRHPREVIRDPAALDWGGFFFCRARRDYFIRCVPLGEARLGRIGFDEWFRRSGPAA